MSEMDGSSVQVQDSVNVAPVDDKVEEKVYKFTYRVPGDSKDSTINIKYHNPKYPISYESYKTRDSIGLVLGGGKFKTANSTLYIEVMTESYPVEFATVEKFDSEYLGEMSIVSRKYTSVKDEGFIIHNQIVTDSSGVCFDETVKGSCGDTYTKISDINRVHIICGAGSDMEVCKAIVKSLEIKAE